MSCHSQFYCCFLGLSKRILLLVFDSSFIPMMCLAVCERMGIDGVAPFVLILIFNPEKNLLLIWNSSNVKHHYFFSISPSLRQTTIVVALSSSFFSFYGLSTSNSVSIQLNSFALLSTWHVTNVKLILDISEFVLAFLSLDTYTHDHRIGNACSTHTKCVSYTFVLFDLVHILFPLRWLRNNILTMKWTEL